jgi:hypothetical protein
MQLLLLPFILVYMIIKVPLNIIKFRCAYACVPSPKVDFKTWLKLVAEANYEQVAEREKFAIQLKYPNLSNAETERQTMTDDEGRAYCKGEESLVEMIELWREYFDTNEEAIAALRPYLKDSYPTKEANLKHTAAVLRQELAKRGRLMPVKSGIYVEEVASNHTISEYVLDITSNNKVSSKEGLAKLKAQWETYFDTTKEAEEALKPYLKPYYTTLNDMLFHTSAMLKQEILKKENSVITTS